MTSTATERHIGRVPTLRPLVAITLLNYVAQVPYYLHFDYSSKHPLPGLRALVLLGGTLAWFSCGLVGFRRRMTWGYWMLLSFLVVEAVFYLGTLATGLFVSQLRDHTWPIDVVFVIGYISGLTAAYYAYCLLRVRRSWNRETSTDA